MHLTVYDQSPAADGCHSGCAHVHAVTDEAYFVLADLVLIPKRAAARIQFSEATGTDNHARGSCRRQAGATCAPH
jgi:hypothetical protein